MSFYTGAKFTIDIRETLIGMERRIMEEIIRLDDGQRNLLVVRTQTLDNDLTTAYFTTDARGKTLWVSKTWTLWTGITNDEARGNGWENGISPEDYPRVTQGWQLAVDHQRSYADKYSYIDRGGARLRVYVVATPIQRRDGTVLNYFGNAKLIDAPPVIQNILLAAAEPKA